VPNVTLDDAIGLWIQSQSFQPRLSPLYTTTGMTRVIVPRSWWRVVVGYVCALHAHCVNDRFDGGVSRGQTGSVG
jgi:hypothetical protein